MSFKGLCGEGCGGRGEGEGEGERKGERERGGNSISGRAGVSCDRVGVWWSGGRGMVERRWGMLGKWLIVGGGGSEE